MDGSQNKSSQNHIDYAPAGPGTIGGTYLRKFWQPVALSKEIAPGKAMPIHVMGEKFTLYRGETGTAHVVGFRCSHRSAQLSVGWVRGDCIQCMYHGWTFDGEGQCVNRPGELEEGPFPRADIPGYPVREHLGIIYAYLGEGETPEFPSFIDYPIPDVLENHVLTFPSNWFQTMENHFDEAHVTFVHSFGGSHNALERFDVPEMNIYETDYGMIRETNVPGGDRVRKTLYYMPNIMRIIIPTFNDLMAYGGWRDTFIIIVPTDDNNHRVFFTMNTHVDDDDMEAYKELQKSFAERVKAYPPIHELAHEILAGKSHLLDHMDHPHLLLLEDSITQAGQGQMVDRSKEMLGRTDVGVAAMRRVYDREMRAVANGEPGKTWVFSGEQPDPGFD